MQFFLTGDASNETFSKIVETKKDFFKKDEDYISFVMLPHHGSIENKIEWLKPDIIGVSAGNGNKHKNRHPDKELVDWITKQKYNGKVLLKNSFESMIMYQKSVKDDGFLFENGPEKMPFICTNLLGDIKISKDKSSENLVFSAKFSGIFKDKDGVSYEIDYSNHVDVPEFLNDEHKDRSIQKASNGEYYLCLKGKFEVKDKGGNKKTETKPLYYHAMKLENNASTVADIKEQ